MLEGNKQVYVCACVIKLSHNGMWEWLREDKML